MILFSIYEYNIQKIITDKWWRMTFCEWEQACDYCCSIIKNQFSWGQKLNFIKISSITVRKSSSEYIKA